MTVASNRLLSLCLAFAASLAILAPDGASAQSRDRHDRRMVIINDTGRIIQAFHATNAGITSWGRDLLGSGVVRQGQRHLLDFDDGTGSCRFDFKAVLDNGRKVERYGVNVCENSSWTVR